MLKVKVCADSLLRWKSVVVHDASKAENPVLTSEVRQEGQFAASSAAPATTQPGQYPWNPGGPRGQLCPTSKQQHSQKHRQECLSALDALQVSDELLAEVALGCPRLQRVSISNCSSVTDKGVRGLAAGAPRLLAFVADDVGRLTDGSLLALGESCKCLQVIVSPAQSC